MSVTPIHTIQQIYETVVMVGMGSFVAWVLISLVIEGLRVRKRRLAKQP